jgi:hypothetical protein
VLRGVRQNSEARIQKPEFRIHGAEWSASRAEPTVLQVEKRDSIVVIIPRAHAQKAEFAAAVARVEQQLHPNVVRIYHTFGNDWTGEASVFFMVVLSDAASRREQLLNVTNGVSNAIVQQVEPLEQWGVLPYFKFRSQSEQALHKEEVST